MVCRALNKWADPLVGVLGKVFRAKLRITDRRAQELKVVEETFELGGKVVGLVCELHQLILGHVEVHAEVRAEGLQNVQGSVHVFSCAANHTIIQVPAVEH